MRNNDIILNEELNKITSLMSYNRSLTLNENIQEQTGPPAFIPRWIHNDPTSITGYQGDKTPYNTMGNAVSALADVWDHDTSSWVEIALVGAGVLLSMTGIGAPIGGLLIGAGTALGVMDAMVYYEEGDPYMGTMMLALNLIPGTELAGILTKKAGAEVTEQTVKQAAEAISKTQKGKALTDAEGWAYEQFVKAFKATAPEVVQETAKKAIALAREGLKTLKLYQIIKLGAKIGKTVFKVGRIAVTVDQLWTLMATPESWRMKMRNKSDFSKIMDMLYDGKLDDVLIDGLWELWNNMWNKDGSENTEGREKIRDLIAGGNFSDEELQSTEYTEAIQNQMDSKFSEHVHNVRNEWEKNSTKVESQKSNFEPVKFDNLVKGLQTIRKGQKGAVVRDIQRMLVTLGYNLGTSGKLGDGVDGDFGDTTEAAVTMFQIRNRLEDKDGIVGPDTSNKLYELYKEKKGL